MTGKRILFINGLLGGDFSALDIGITVLASYVNRHSEHEAAIADLTFHSRHWRRHLNEEIVRKRPEVFALSCNTMYMKYVRTIVAELQEQYPEVPVVLGGHHATVHPDDTFSVPGVAALVIGDGEEPLIAYLDRLTSGEGYAGVPGLWVRGEDGEVRNPGGAFLADINRLPWLDWDLWDDLDLYLEFLGMLYVQGSRGCPYRCTFCDAQGYAQALKESGRYFRLRDPRAFARELQHYYERYAHRGMRLFQIFDPVFTMDDTWLEEFCDEYQRLGLHEKIRYSVFSRVDHLNEEKVRLLARSGCALLRVGIESGDENIRMDVYKKRIDNETVRRIFKVAKEGGLDFTAFYILGGPRETQRSFRDTIRFAWELDGARSAFFVYKPFTDVGRAQLEQEGGGVDEERWQKADNITWGGTTHGADWGPRTVEAYQMAAYGLTFGRRLLRMLYRRGPRYFPALARYMTRGVAMGLDWRYLAIYFHIYEGDNVDR